MRMDGTEPINYRAAPHFARPWQQGHNTSMRLFTLRSVPDAALALRQKYPDVVDVLEDFDRAVNLIQVFISIDDAQENPQCSKLEETLEHWEELQERAFNKHWQNLAATQDPASLTRERHIADACRVALIAFAVLVTTAKLRSSVSRVSQERSLGDLVARLRLHIAEADVQDFWKPMPGALLWCTMVGAVAATKTKQVDGVVRPWFRMQLFRVCCAFWFATGEPGGEVIESFNSIEAGLQAATVLTESSHDARRVGERPSQRRIIEFETK